MRSARVDRNAAGKEYRYNLKSTSGSIDVVDRDRRPMGSAGGAGGSGMSRTMPSIL